MLMMNYLLMCFTDFVPDAAVRSEIGYYYIYINFSNIGFHIINMLFTSAIGCKNNCRLKSLRKKNMKEHLIKMEERKRRLVIEKLAEKSKKAELD